MEFLKSNKSIRWISTAIGAVLGIAYLSSGGLSPIIIIIFTADLIRLLANLVRIKLYAGVFEGKLNNSSLGKKLSIILFISLILGIELMISRGHLGNIPTIERILFHMFSVFNILKLSAKIKVYENGLYISGVFCQYDELYISKVLESGDLKFKTDTTPVESFVLERNYSALAESVLRKIKIGEEVTL